MKKLLYLCLCCSFLFLVSCSKNSSPINKQERTYTSLTERFQSIPGIQVTGNDYNGHIRLTGAGIVTTQFADDSPLFVVDGQQVGRDLASLASILNPNDIKKIKVLKTPDQTSDYGIRGSSGVIVITTKKK